MSEVASSTRVNVADYSELLSAVSALQHYATLSGLWNEALKQGGQSPDPKALKDLGKDFVAASDRAKPAFQRLRRVLDEDNLEQQLGKAVESEHIKPQDRPLVKDAIERSGGVSGVAQGIRSLDASIDKQKKQVEGRLRSLDGAAASVDRLEGDSMTPLAVPLGGALIYGGVAVIGFSGATGVGLFVGGAMIGGGAFCLLYTAIRMF